MLKYIGLFLLALGLSIYVTTENEKHSQPSAQNSQGPSPAPLAPNATEESKGDVKQSKWNPPDWYRFFTWPDGLTAWALFLTLMAIAEQTQETRKAAEAARLNAQAVVKAERAWIMVDLEWSNAAGPVNLFATNTKDPITSISFLLKCFNEGKTPCWITGKRMFAEIVDIIPEKPDVSKLTVEMSGFEPVKVGKESPILNGGIGVPGHLSGNKTLVIWGIVTYQDAFGENHETFWGYYVQPKTGGPHLRRITSSVFNKWN